MNKKTFIDTTIGGLFTVFAVGFIISGIVSNLELKVYLTIISGSSLFIALLISGIQFINRQ